MKIPQIDGDVLDEHNQDLEKRSSGCILFSFVFGISLIINVLVILMNLQNSRKTDLDAQLQQTPTTTGV